MDELSVFQDCPDAANFTIYIEEQLQLCKVLLMNLFQLCQCQVAMLTQLHGCWMASGAATRVTVFHHMVLCSV